MVKLEGSFYPYYACNIIYDTLLILVAVGSILYSYGRFEIGSGKKSTMQVFQRRLMADGLVYYFAARTIQVINVVFFAIPTWKFKVTLSILYDTGILWWETTNLTESIQDVNISMCNAITSVCASRLVLLKLGG